MTEHTPTRPPIDDDPRTGTDDAPWEGNETTGEVIAVGPLTDDLPLPVEARVCVFDLTNPRGRANMRFACLARRHWNPKQQRDDAVRILRLTKALRLAITKVDDETASVLLDALEGKPNPLFSEE